MKSNDKRNKCPDCDGLKSARAATCRPCAVAAGRASGGNVIGSDAGPRSAAPEKPAPAAVPAVSDSAEDKLLRQVGVLKHDLAQARRSIDQLQSRKAVEEIVSEAVVQTIDANPYMPTFEAPAMDTSNARSHEMLLLVSDAHYPEVVSGEECYGQEYGPEICMRRMQQTRDAALSYIARRDYEVGRLTIGVIGDMLSGDIHEELSISNATPMAQALVDMSNALFEMGSDLAKVVPVEMVVMPGNHPRTTKKPTAKYKWNNYEYLMGQLIKALAGDRFGVTVPKDLVYQFDVFGRRVGLTHGDGIKVQSFAGIPHYSLQRRRNALQQLLRETGSQQLDLLCYGHFHQLIYDDLAGFLINGSIKGTDEFGAAARYAYSRPTQALVTFHERHFVTDVSRIVLE